jgi:4-amino-4-deoxy-L-arabinose transferase-like glycosyltransferase
MKPEPTVVTGACLRVAVLLAAFGVAYGGVLLLEGRERIGWGVACLAAAAVAIVVAGLGHHLPVGDGERARRWLGLPPGLGWWLLLAVAIGAGIAFRLHLIGSLPYGIWFDEAQNGIVARRILEDPGYRPVFIGDATQLPALFFYVFALALKLIGHGVLALRLVATAAGILTLVFTYLLARELFDQRIAVLATFLLAVMRWHVNFSRFAMHGIFAPLFMAATFYFLVRGLKGKGVSNFVGAGVMMGVGLQGYYSFLLVPFIIAAVLLHHIIVARALAWRRLVAGVSAFVLVTAAVYAPVGIWALQHPDEFNRRAQTVTVTKDHSLREVAQIVYRSARQHLLMFSSAGDRNGRHNLPGAPMLDSITGCLFALGVGLALWRWRDPGHFLLLVWVAVVLQGGIWSVDFEAPQGHRTLGLTPAVAMLAALPVGLLWRLARSSERESHPAAARRWPTQLAVWALVGTAAVVTATVVVESGRHNFETYFGNQLRRADVWPEYSTDVTLIGREMARLGPGHDFWLATTLIGQPTIEFITSEAVRRCAQPFHWIRDLPARGDGTAVYFLEWTKEGFFEWLKRLYPGGSFRSYSSPAAGSPVMLYQAVIPGDAVKALRGLDAVYTPASGPALTRREMALDLDWSAGAPGPLPLHAVWTGFLEAPEYREYRLVLEAPGELRLELDGERAAEGSDRLELARSLYHGEHALRVEADIDRPGPIRLSWDGEPVPGDALFAYPLGGHGLLGAFFTNDRWEGAPAHVELTPLLGFGYHTELTLVAPLSVRWQGYLDVPGSGEYLIRLNANEEGSLAIDGREILRTPQANTGIEARLDLTTGPHPIEVRLRNTGGSAAIFLSWTPPGGRTEIIPPERLSPR